MLEDESLGDESQEPERVIDFLMDIVLLLV